MKDSENGPDMLNEIPDEKIHPIEASDGSRTNSKLSPRKIFIVFAMTVSSLLALLCILLFVSTLPKEECIPFSGVYYLSYGEMEGSKISSSEVSAPVAIELSDNGWCHIGFGNEIHTGRWSNDNGKLSIRCWNTNLEGSIESGQLRIKSVLGREIDLIFSF